MKREFGSQVDGNEREGGGGEAESADVRVFRSHWAYFYGARKRSMMVMMMMMPRRQLLPWSGPGSSSCSDGPPRRRPSTPVAPSLALWVSDATMTSVAESSDQSARLDWPARRAGGTSSLTPVPAQLEQQLLRALLAGLCARAPLPFTH